MSSIMRSFNCTLCSRSFGSVKGLSVHRAWHKKYDKKDEPQAKKAKDDKPEKAKNVNETETNEPKEDKPERVEPNLQNADETEKEDKTEDVELIVAHADERETKDKTEKVEPKNVDGTKKTKQKKDDIGETEDGDENKNKDRKNKNKNNNLDGYLKIDENTWVKPLGKAVPKAHSSKQFISDEAECSDWDDNESIASETQSDKDFIDNSLIESESTFYAQVNNKIKSTSQSATSTESDSESESSNEDLRTPVKKKNYTKTKHTPPPVFKLKLNTPEKFRKMSKEQKEKNKKKATEEKDQSKEQEEKDKDKEQQDKDKEQEEKDKDKEQEEKDKDKETVEKNDTDEEMREVLEKLPELPPSYVPCVNKGNFWPGFDLGNRIETTHTLEPYLSYYKVPEKTGKGKCFSGFLIRFVIKVEDPDVIDKAIALLIKYMNQLKLRTKYLTGPLAQNHFILMDRMSENQEVVNYYLLFRLPQSIIPASLCKKIAFDNDYLKLGELYLLRAGANLQQMLEEISLGNPNIVPYSAGSLNINVNNQLQVDMIKEFALENDITDIVGLSQYRKFRNAPILNTETEACECGCGFTFATHKAHISNAKKLYMRNDEIAILKNVISANSNVINHDLQKKTAEEVFFENLEKFILEIAEKKYYGSNLNTLPFYVIFWHIFGGKLKLDAEGETFDLSGKQNVKSNIENLLYNFFVRCVRGLHKRRALVFYGGFNSGKSTVSLCLSNTLPYECIDLNGEITKFTLGVASTKKLILVDDINGKGLKNLDMEFRNALDGFNIQLERKFHEPRTGRAPPFLLTTNILPEAFPVGLKHRLKAIHFEHSIPEALLAFFCCDFQSGSAEFLFFCLNVLNLSPHVDDIKKFFIDIVKEKTRQALSDSQELNASLSEY